MEAKFLQDALFGGMTGNAFKLGTVLSLGWFWQRVSGCNVLYRGRSMEDVEFGEVAGVSELGSGIIKPAGYLNHESNSTYFYVVRRVNRCGKQEHSLSASVKVSFDSEGELTGGQPNRVFGLKVRQSESGKVQLLWFYQPLSERKKPVCFKVFYDGGSGQIDFENELADIAYRGPGYYVYESEALEGGSFIFAVKTEDSDGGGEDNIEQVSIEFVSSGLSGVDVLSVDVI